MHQPPLILVVDDHPGTRAELCALIARAGMQTVIAAQGHEALRFAHELRPDLAMLDLDADEFGAIELLRSLKSSTPETFVPVVLHSIRADREVRLAALRSGADDVLTRPWDAEELIARLEAMLRIKSQQDRAAARSVELERLSITDELTGLHNRRYFRERLREEFRRAQRYDEPLSLVIIDLDHFKAINDRYGHLSGDEALRQAGKLLPSCVRDTDVVSRFGGEEFTVLLPQTHLSGCLTVAERIWRALRSHSFAIGDETLQLTASIGVSSFPARDVVTPDDLLRTADQALYRAKRTGRDRICLHQPAGYILATEEPPRRLAASRTASR